MQLKKMREVLPTFYASQANKGHDSLLIEPLKQTSIKKENQVKTNNENSNFDYQKIKETQMHQISCIKCRCVEKTSELLKLKCQASEGYHYVCNKCHPSTPYDLYSGIDLISASKTEKEKIPLSKMLRIFKTKNFQPDKYYCDKCQFATKDPLQHKIHIVEHEKIRFICSQCSRSFYTKEAFQQHLVKHTGQFPYQCKYCEYGAAGHDYTANHTKRLHETVHEKQANLTVAKTEQQPCLPNPSPLQKEAVQGDPLQNRSASLSDTVCGIKVPPTVCASNIVESSQDTAYMHDINTFNSADSMMIEVEVFSPKTEPLIPGMPLTVVAPPNFICPSNCFAQIVEINKIGDTQQLTLKFIPFKEITSLTEKYKEAEFGNLCAEQRKKTNETVLPNANDSSVLINEYHKCLKCPVSSSSTVLKYNLMSTHNENIWKESTNKERTLPIDTFSGEINYSECFPKGKYPKKEHTNYNLDSCISLASSSLEGRNASPLFDAVQENSIPSSCNKMCFTLSNAGKEHWDEFRAATETQLLDSGLFCPEKESQCNALLTLDDVLGEVNGGNMQRNNYNHMEFSGAKISDEGEFADGPVISSVFSLSTGPVSIPEGITWNDTSHKKKSTSLLCRKIAQLMSAVASDTKSQLVAPLKHDKSKASKEKVLSSLVKQCERNGSATKFEEYVSCPQRVNEYTPSNELSNKQEQDEPSEILTQTIMENRVTSKIHSTPPVFIPHGTVLRALNFPSSEGLTEKESGKERFPSSSMFLPRPVPCISAKLDKHSSLPRENKINEVSENSRISHEPKTNKDIMKGSNPQNGVLTHPKDSYVYKANKRAMKEELQSESKQLYDEDNLSPKRPRIEDDGCFTVMPILMRQLRLIPFKNDQLIKHPHRNQPVVVLNHPDADSPHIINVMKVINKYKGSVIKTILSPRTISYLSVKQHHRRLTFQNFDGNIPVKTQDTFKMK